MEAQVLRALIQRAAAALKLDLGDAAGVSKLTAASEAALEAVRARLRAEPGPEARLRGLDALAERVGESAPLRS